MHYIDEVPTAPNSPSSSQLHSQWSEFSLSPQIDDMSDMELMSSYDDVMLDSLMSEVSMPHSLSPTQSSFSFVMPRSIGMNVGKLRLAIVGKRAVMLVSALADHLQPTKHFHGDGTSSHISPFQLPHQSITVASSSSHEPHNIELIAYEDTKYTEWLENHLYLGSPIDAVICAELLPHDDMRSMEKLTTVFQHSDEDEEANVLRHILTRSGDIRRKRTILNANYYESTTSSTSSKEASNRSLNSINSSSSDLPQPPRGVSRRHLGEIQQYNLSQFTFNSIENVDPLRLGDWDTVPRLCGELFATAIELATPRFMILTTEERS